MTISLNMLMAASQALAAHSPQATLERGGLLPAVEDIGEISRAIALATARAAQQDGVAPQASDDELHAAIEKTFWEAQYAPYKRASF